MLQGNQNDLKNLDIRTVLPESLQDIKSVSVNTELPVEERMKEFIRQIKNPYFFRCGKLIVQVEYCETGKTIHDCIKEYIDQENDDFV